MEVLSIYVYKGITLIIYKVFCYSQMKVEKLLDEIKIKTILSGQALLSGFRKHQSTFSVWPSIKNERKKVGGIGVAFLDKR